MAKFKKGVSGNPKGRTKGTKNEKTIIWNEIGESFVNKTMPLFMAKLQKLIDSENTKDNIEGMKICNSMLEFFQPKLSRTELIAEVEIKDEVDLTQYSLEDLKDSIESNKNTD